MPGICVAYAKVQQSRFPQVTILIHIQLFWDVKNDDLGSGSPAAHRRQIFGIENVVVMRFAMQRYKKLHRMPNSGSVKPGSQDLCSFYIFPIFDINSNISITQSSPVDIETARICNSYLIPYLIVLKLHLSQLTTGRLIKAY
jgi:hypothetical protein